MRTSASEIKATTVHMDRKDVEQVLAEHARQELASSGTLAKIEQDGYGGYALVFIHDKQS